ncbi:MAG: outer membrane protein assembly factor BamA [Planctomycetes bacterium]|nr:outer membrane protein assembly factor BamA [Planctomycetota bacterium]
MHIMRSPFRWLPLVSTAAALWLAQAPAGAQDAVGEDEIVIEVRWVGVDSDSQETLKALIATAPGQVFDADRLEADRRRLLGSQAVLDVVAQVERTDDGVVVTFRVRHRDVVRAIRIVGNTKLSERTLTGLVPATVGQPLDLFRAREGRQAIEDRYRDRGYGSAVVTLDMDQARDGELVFTIEEGPRVRIRKVQFVGNDAFPDSRLAKSIRSKPALWIIRDGYFDVDTAQRDASTIQRFYRDEGYLDARVSYRSDFDDTREDLTLTFVIGEATRYRVESISLEGNTVYSDDELRDNMTLQPNDFFRRQFLERDIGNLRTRYRENGYIYADLPTPSPVFSVTPGLVSLTFEIVEGQQFRVGHVYVRGNETTKEKVVRRALKLLPGDVFNLPKAKQAEQDLVRTQLFSLATVTPVGRQPGVRDIVINVEESTQAGDFIFAAGVNSNSGLIGSIVLDLKNFDLGDRPRSFSELVNLRAFHGAGQRMRIEAQPGTQLSRFRIDFTEPYLLDLPIHFGTSLYLFARGRDAYTEGRTGANVSFGRRLTAAWVDAWSGPAWLKDWYGEVALRVEEARADDLNLFAARRIRDDEGSHLLTSLKIALARDRTDNRFLPTEGDSMRFSWEQFGVLGGDRFFAKLTGRYAWHHTMKIDAQERKSVLSLKANVGAIIGNAPIFERFYAGGIGSMRGFNFRGVSPRQGLQDDAIGGDFMLLTAAEYSFPLHGQAIRGVVFVDMGTVEDSFELTTWRAAVGVGVRVLITQLGSLPMEFDLALPISSQEDDEEQVFSFLLGVSF